MPAPPSPPPPSPPPPSPPSGKCSDGKKWAKIAKGAGCSNFDTIQLTDTWYKVGSDKACGDKCKEMKKEGCVGFSYATKGKWKEMKKEGCVGF